MISGLNKTDLILIASRPGMGKTSIALNMALAAAKKEQKTVTIFSLEMSKEQLAARLLAAEAFVDSKKVLTGDLSENDWTKFAVATENLSRCDIRIDDNPTVSPAVIKGTC